MSQPAADVGRLAVGCHVQVYWREYEDWLDAVVRSYRDSRHYIVYEDGQEDVGIIDGRNLWLFEDDKWTSMRLRWKDEDVNRGLSYSSAYNRVEPEAQRDTGDGKKPAASEAKDDAQSAPGVPVTADNPAGGFMIGCDMCDNWYYGWNVDITEHEAKDIKKYICPNTVYLVSGVAGAPLPLTNASFGPRRSRHATLQLREVRSFAEIPGPLVWLQHAWVLGANPVRYGVNNLFHSVTEDIEWLAKLARCGRLRVGGSSRLLLLHGKALLNNSTLGLLWDLASGGARAYHLQQGGEDTFCFRLAHAETHGSPEQLRDVRAACARARAWDETAWEGWPADKRDVFKGFPSIVHAAFARLRLPEPPERAADGKWARPRVTIVHRLRNRRLLNVRYLAVLLRDAGYDVTVGGFECLPMHEQIAIAANSSTLIGVHGAGLLTRSFSSCAQRRALRRRTARITTACAAGAASCPPRATRSCPTARAPRRGA
ncbi:hypothetical protein KFE25_000851 [Diacronema lutheri]|uniref:Glycosyltransferase 61 catalytic domain-containing protein n=1 Tax=Diacronema lutheri TaxID=2081491 RepID=A0A8J5XTB2_DIALT|nr:hypothetical protein KFE25_000851 [Diacronema lutheri]